jgi:hypothetical protein
MQVFFSFVTTDPHYWVGVIINVANTCVFVVQIFGLIISSVWAVCLTSSASKWAEGRLLFRPILRNCVVIELQVAVRRTVTFKAYFVRLYHYAAWLNGWVHVHCRTVDTHSVYETLWAMSFKLTWQCEISGPHGEYGDSLLECVCVCVCARVRARAFCCSWPVGLWLSVFKLYNYHEDGCLLGRCTVQSCRNLVTFQSWLRRPSSGRWVAMHIWNFGQFPRDYTA